MFTKPTTLKPQAAQTFDIRFGQKATSPCPFEKSNCFVYGNISKRRTINGNKIIGRGTVRVWYVRVWFRNSEGSFYAWGEQWKIRKSGTVKGPAIRPTSRSLFNLFNFAKTMCGFSKALFRLRDSKVVHITKTKTERKPQIRKCLESACRVSGISG